MLEIFPETSTVKQEVQPDKPSIHQPPSRPLMIPKVPPKPPQPPSPLPRRLSKYCYQKGGTSPLSGFAIVKTAQGSQIEGLYTI